MESLSLFTIIGGFFLTTALICAIFIAVDLRTHKQGMKIMAPVWVLTGLWASILGLIAYLLIGRSKKSTKEDSKAMHTSDFDSMSSQKMNMGSMKMDKTNMENMDMKNMKMDNTNMENMDMKNMKMDNADMENMDMKNMKMDNTAMENMDMKSMKMDNTAMENMDMKNMKGMDMNLPKWQSIGLSALHCGAGCTLADIIGESFTGLHPIYIGGSFLIGAWIFDYILALIIGVYFQYAAIREMDSKINIQKAIEKATKADFLSLTSWQIGMYGWMAISIFIINDGYQYSKTSVDFWFNMQIAMLCGFITAYPMNWFLIKIGLKKGM